MSIAGTERAELVITQLGEMAAEYSLFGWRKTDYDISARTGVSVNTLLSRKHYAVLHLRKQLRSIYDEFLKGG